MQLEWKKSNMFRQIWRPMIGYDYSLDDPNKPVIANTCIVFDYGCYTLKVSNIYYGEFDTLIEAQIKAHEVISDLCIHQDYRFPDTVCHMDGGCWTYHISHDIIGWKKAMSEDGEPVVVKLKIPKGTDANITAGKCRAEYATVLDAYYIFSDKKVVDKYIYSLWALNNISKYDRMAAKEKIDLNHELGMFRPGSRYKVGDTIFIPNFSRGPSTCASGVHFFRSRYIAERYMFS